MVEKQIQGRELEIAVLGNHNPEVSLVGEIVLKEFFEAKYLDEKGVMAPKILVILYRVQKRGWL